MKDKVNKVITKSCPFFLFDSISTIKLLPFIVSVFYLFLFCSILDTFVRDDKSTSALSPRWSFTDRFLWTSSNGVYIRGQGNGCRRPKKPLVRNYRTSINPCPSTVKDDEGHIRYRKKMQRTGNSRRTPVSFHCTTQRILRRTTRNDGAAPPRSLSPQGEKSKPRGPLRRPPKKNSYVSHSITFKSDTILSYSVSSSYRCGRWRRPW